MPAGHLHFQGAAHGQARQRLQQAAAVLQTPVMLSAHQKMHVGGCRLLLVVKFINIRFAVGADQHLRLGHLARQRAGLLQRPNPTSALFLIQGLLVAVEPVAWLRSRPQLGPGIAQRDAVQAKGLQAMQEQSATVSLPNRPQTGGLVQCVVAQAGGILSQEHHPLGGHAAGRLLLVGRQQAGQIDFHPAIFQQLIGPFGLGRIVKAATKTARRPGPALAQHALRPLVEPLIAQRYAVHLLLRPVCGEGGRKHRARRQHLRRTLLQPGPGFGVQFINPHIFGALGALALAIIPAPALALAQPAPIGRRQRAAMIVDPIHIRLHQHGSDAIADLPILAHLPQGQAITLGGQIRHAQPAANQKTGQADHLVSILLPGLEAPTHPPVPAFQMISGRAKAQSPHDARGAFDQVAHLGADQRTTSLRMLAHDQPIPNPMRRILLARDEPQA